MLARAQSQAAPLGEEIAAALAPIPSPKIDVELLARVDEVLAGGEAGPEPAEGELF